MQNTADMQEPNTKNQSQRITDEMAVSLDSLVRADLENCIENFQNMEI